MTYFRLFETRITNSVTINAGHAQGHAGDLNILSHTYMLPTRRLTELYQYSIGFNINV